MRIHFKLLVVFCFLCTAAVFLFQNKELRFLKKRARSYGKMMARVEKGFRKTTPVLGNLTLPVELQNVPLADSRGVVLRTKEVTIRDVVAPYNPSLIENEKGYLIVFRFDVIEQTCPTGFYTYIGLAQLDQNFDQTEEEYKVIATGSLHSEDPRAIKVGEDIYLFFNDVHPLGSINGRTMRVGKVNLAESKLEYNTDLDLQIQHIEKNWVPFEYIGENEKPDIYIEYHMNPHKILKLPNPEVSFVEHLSFPGISASQRTYWPHIWGSPRGGSCARKVGDQYVSFFHSYFRDSNNYFWYLMGAYTFESKPPFRVTKISHYPILFEGIYHSPIMNTAPSNKKVIFPAGFAYEEKDGKTLIHVACGENDCAIKIVTFDGEALMKGLKKI